MFSTNFQTKTFQVACETSKPYGHCECPEDAVPLLRAILRDECDANKEHFIVLALDSRLRIIAYKIIAVGTLSACLVDPAAVFRAGIASSASSLIVAHSHPSQDPTPSDQDRELTDRLVRAGEVVGLPILDHIVLASSGAEGSPWTAIGPRPVPAISTSIQASE